MNLKNLDLIVTMIITTTNVIWALLPYHTPIVGIVLALPLLFVLPGYTLTEALFHQRSLEASHRLILGLGLSLAIDIPGGFVLNVLPAGLQGISWSVFLGLLVTIFSLLVMKLRRGAPINVQQPLRFRFTIYEFILFGLALTVAILSIQYSATSIEQQPHPGFTQLWMLPSTQADNSCIVRLGVRSFESTSVMYRIEVTVNGAQINMWPSVTLAPQEEWDQLVSIDSKAIHNVYVEVKLYRLDRSAVVYRKVNLTFHITRGSTNGSVKLCNTL